MCATGAPVFNNESRETLKSIRILHLLLLIIYASACIFGIFGRIYIMYGMIVDIVYSLFEIMFFFGCKYFDYGIICFFRIFILCYDLAWFITACVRSREPYDIVCTVLLSFALILNPAAIHFYSKLPRYESCCCCPPTAQNPLQTAQYEIPPGTQPGQIIQLPNGQQIIYQPQFVAQTVVQPVSSQPVPQQEPRPAAQIPQLTLK